MRQVRHDGVNGLATSSDTKGRRGSCVGVERPAEQGSPSSAALDATTRWGTGDGAAGDAGGCGDEAPRREGCGRRSARHGAGSLCCVGASRPTSSAPPRSGWEAATRDTSARRRDATARPRPCSRPSSASGRARARAHGQATPFPRNRRFHSPQDMWQTSGWTRAVESATFGARHLRFGSGLGSAVRYTASIARRPSKPVRSLPLCGFRRNARRPPYRPLAKDLRRSPEKRAHLALPPS